MGKRVPTKERVYKDSLSQTPSFDRPRKKMNFKEIKKRSILAGLRTMKAPAVAWPKGGSDTLVKKYNGICNIYIYTYLCVLYIK